VTATALRRFPRLFRTALWLGAILIALLLAEIGLRLSGYDSHVAPRAGIGLALRPTEWPDLHYELAPGVNTYAWGTEVMVNGRGYRGPEVPIVEGRKRIVVLGDSITFGNRLPFDVTYPAVLHRLLSPLGGDVINLGVGGYDTIQEVALLKKRGLAERPDVVVVGFCLNDAGVVSGNLEFMESELAWRHSWWAELRLAAFFGGMVERRRLRNWQREMNEPGNFRRRYRNLIDEIAADDPVRKLMAAAPDVHPARWYQSAERVGRIRNGFTELGRLSRAHGFTVIVAIIPALIQRQNEYPYGMVHEIVAYEARRAGLDVVDFGRSFLAAGMDSLRIDPGDGIHPNARGHEIMAAALEARLRDFMPGDAGETGQSRRTPLQPAGNGQRGGLPARPEIASSRTIFSSPGSMR